MSLVLKDGVVVVIEADQTGQHFHQVGWGVQRRRLSYRVRQTKAPQVRLCQ